MFVLLAWAGSEVKDATDTTATGISKPTGAPAPATSVASLAAKAVDECKARAVDLLRAPLTAEWDQPFPGKALTDDNRTFGVSGVVDSQNAFGALVRSLYSCQVVFDGVDGWVVNNPAITPW